jgi:type IV pilus assembly protein PilW
MSAAIDKSASSRFRLVNQRGLTLVEMMVALVIGLVLVIAMSALFVNSSTSRREVELSSDVIESGRYAIDVLSRELVQTGFYGSLEEQGLPPLPALPLTESQARAYACSPFAQWEALLRYYVVGFSSAANVNVDADPTCLPTPRKPGTDAVFIQRSSTCNSVECGPEDPALAYLQVSDCGEEYNTAGTKIVLKKGGDAAFVLKTKACAAAVAERRQLVRRIYYVSPADVLSYIELRPDDANPPVPVAVVENIEQMQISYGFDTKPGDGSGTADCFASKPDLCGLPEGAWYEAVGMRIWLVARSSTPSKNTADAISFTLDDTTLNIASANRNLKRRVYSTFISFVTPKARREF